ncbi:SDR family NAD(P)-dependent oxidoreductase [Chromobacterium sphagni]|uniref:Short-chain dehydrogenase n=1 Tax=Chromobacterium sphagni TaxID=1903179 RepID=A0A1S1X064_9NEIS|nr:SDR family NAD(P)-dependent oxidoreductase [Chromobacterium sphagni]OHX12576.1 short-chain dehydrogenase [Chromobacterium sphagni]OHX21339.1 short-chain dehydrogenase [Chromobacterium sphagni]
MALTLNPAIDDWSLRRVWVVGSSSGIGAALAEQLLQAGAEVILSSRSIEPLRRLANHYPRARVEPLDVSQPPAWNAAWLSLLRQDKLPDLVVFCAADYRPEHIWQVESALADRTLAVNLAGVYYGLETILPHMLAQGRGGIALIASVAGYVGLPGAAVYGPSKAALINLAELLYAELNPRGLAVYLINPGFVKTALTARNHFAMPALLTPPQAAGHIRRGLERGRFEIHFPYRFTLWLKLLRMLPYRLRLPLLKRLART